MDVLPEGLHGAYTRVGLAQEIGPKAMRTAVRAGRLKVYSRDVLVDPRQATEFRCRAAAAMLCAGPNATLNSHSALVIRGISAADLAPIHVLLPYPRTLRRRKDVAVHYSHLVDYETELVDRLRTVTMPHALAEVLCRGSRRTAIACADQALASVSPGRRDALRTTIDERIRSRRDRRGTVRAATLLDLARGDSESPAESWTLLNLVDGGLPIPEQQVSVTDIDGSEMYRLDFAWPEFRVAVEYDGYAAHVQRAERDAVRDADLRRRGWIVIHATADDLRDPSRLVTTVVEAMRSRGYIVDVT
ncbi:endonuclease domain-containing protein [Haloechinothrix salitolerans]|uniref:Endonuclease domain-containing protein n=1 Tax=Haloechinothrix salitolerans TaxID=926830 RepID=A0ABW2C8X0_9PSEU